MKRLPSGGFSLVEVVVALGLVSFVLVALMGLISTGLNGTRASEESIEAANLASTLVDQWRADPSTLLADLAGSDAAHAGSGPPQASSFQSALLDANGRPVAGGAEPKFKLTYATWRDSSLTNLVRLHLILSAPAGSALANATTRYELQASVNLP